MSIDYKFVTFLQPLGAVLPGAIGEVHVAWLDQLDAPELAAHLDGWEPVSFQAIPVESGIFLMLLVKRTIDVPDDTATLGEPPVP